MKAELIDEQVFTIKVGGVDFAGMRKVSEWNGLIELRNAEGEKLIVSKQAESMADSFDTLFGQIFRTAEQTKAAGVLVVMGSPSLIGRLRMHQSPEGVIRPVDTAHGEGRRQSAAP